MATAEIAEIFVSAIGLTAAFTDLTAPSMLITVPFDSARDTRGRTTSALFAVSVRYISATAKNSIESVLSSAGSSPITKSALIVPFSIFSLTSQTGVMPKSTRPCELAFALI